MEKKWIELSSDEKREERFKKWLSPASVKFSTPKSEKVYKEKVQRLIDVIQLKKPDRVPVMLPIANFPVYYAGSTLHKAMYDYNEIRRSWLKFLHDFDLDIRGPSIILPGKVLENLDYKLYRWPGHGLKPEASSYQCVEGEYMKADEYDALINDPSDFWMRVYLPRIFGAFEPFRILTPFTTLSEVPIGYFIPYTLPQVQDSLQALLDAGKETAKWFEVIMEIDREALAAGSPSIGTNVTKAPFDVIGDTLRGTQGIMTDMYRQPGRLLEALERIASLNIDAVVSKANVTGDHIVFMPLHKGSDGFMSAQQFETFYWPTLRKLILGMIAEGLVPLLFAEGSYNTRLEIVNCLPRGSVIWWFDQTDMTQSQRNSG